MAKVSALCMTLLVLLLGTGNVEAHNKNRMDPPRNSIHRANDHVVQPTHRSTHHARHKLSRHHGGPVLVLARDSEQLVTVPTAAGISITVYKKVASQFQGLIADLVESGYTPPVIHCWAPYGTHVRRSNHYHGGACDFHQRGWGITDPPMYHIASLAAKWGLRDGCSFKHPDCGHVDDGTNIAWKHPNLPLQRYITQVTSPVSKREQYGPPNLDTFEE